jgi:hypothetical protein
MTRVMGVGTVAGPIDVLVLLTSSGVIAAIAISTGGSAEVVVITGIGITIGPGVVAGRHS